jgi:hypothetical protein
MLSFNLSKPQDQTQLRPLEAADFEASCKEVTPSVGSDSALMDELKQWNSQYGEGSKRGGYNPKLSYFI